MNWQEVCEDPQLQDLPYKIELNRFGQIVMSPASNEHGFFQSSLAAVLNKAMGTGKVFSECSVLTTDGVRVADVAWSSDEFFEEYKFATPFPKAPEICVEIVSPSNSREEIERKVSLYSEAGAVEVWLVKPGGVLEFRIDGDIHSRSRLAPGLSSEGWD